MQFSIEKYISNFIENQFPQFYKEDGENFVLFVKAYYEWLEDNGKPIKEARSLLDYRDIDNTLEKFLEHFQIKYLYGIPFNIISNKRFLLKHILDVYRSKGSIQCYKLLFRLIYDEDVDIYLPGNDVIRVSDGTWIQPKYIEVTETPILSSFVGKTIIGKVSGTRATVENFIKECYNNDIVNIVYINNILPNGSDFVVGESIIDINDVEKDIIDYKPPIITGSLDTLSITSGGQDFKVGDVLKIAYKDVFTDEIVSYGKEGLLKVSEISKVSGVLNFKIQSSGFGYTANSLTFVFNNLYDKTGFGGDFDVRTLYAKRSLTYNTDIICGFINVALDDASYGFPSSTGDINTILEDALTYKTEVFGRILSLKNIKVGNNYILPANTFTRSVITSVPMPGVVSYSPNSLELYELKDNSLNSSLYTNGDIVTILNERANVNIIDKRTTNPGETHTLIKDSINYDFYANSSNFSNTTDTIFIYDADSFFTIGDEVYYLVPDGLTPLAGLNGNTYYYISFVNNSSVALTEYAYGTNATVTITTNTSGGDLTFSINNRGSDFITQTPNVVITNSSSGVSTGSGANIDVSFACAVTGNGTSFSTFFVNNDVIYLQSNGTNANTGEFNVIRWVANNTKIYLYGPTTNYSNTDAFYAVAPTTIKANFATYQPEMISANGSINGENEFISAIPSSGNNTISEVKLLDSGKGYVDGEEVRVYLYGAISDTVEIISSGNGYSNNEKLIFSGGNPGTSATGFITTDSIGAITDVTITYGGSGYEKEPEVLVQTNLGKGARLKATVVEFNTQIEVTGTVVKKGSGKSKGFWATTRGFLDSDKYIQDSFYYQDYSYEVRTARILKEYKNILYDTFHSAGSELFGKYLKLDVNQSILTLSPTEEFEANTEAITLYTIVSEDFISCDEDRLTVDDYVYDYFQYIDIETITVDANTASVVSSNTFIFSDIIVVSVDRGLNGSSQINPYYRSDSNSNFITSDIQAY
jgi:hypothetical protein